MMNVYFSIDTESSMAGSWAYPDRRPLGAEKSIFCRIDQRDYGVGLISDTLGRYGFRATFFVEPLVSLVNGEADTRAVVEFLLERGQDVQLHLHPTYRFFAEMLRARVANPSHQAAVTSDLLSGFEEPLQMELIAQSAALLERFSGTRPVAFRAGCFAANTTTLKCLRRAGLRFDTSFNPCYPQWSFSNEDLRPNQVRQIEGVWELPVTVARTPIPEGHGGFKHADPSAISFGELRQMLEHGSAQGLKHFVVLFHSFSAVKPRDLTYAEIKPDAITIKRLRRLAAYLSQHPDRYRVTTFGALSEEAVETGPTDSPVADLSVTRASLRKTVQALNRSYWV